MLIRLIELIRLIKSKLNQLNKLNQPNQPTMKIETKAIRGQLKRTHYREHSQPVFLTSSFTFPDAETMANTFAGEGEGIIYSRYNNPNVDEFIGKVCALEGAEAGFATASGMAAMFASMAAFLEAGDHVIAGRAVFGSTHQILTNILSKWGITHTYVEPENVNSWENAVQSNTKMVVLETPSNPSLKLIDLEKAGKFAQKHNLLLVVDNCFATPYIQRPIAYGADLVVHSGTKWMDGQGRILAGIIVGKSELIEHVTSFCRHTGPALFAFSCVDAFKEFRNLACALGTAL